MTEEGKRLHEDMMENLVLQGKLKVIMEHGTPEEQVKAISELGYNISLEDIQPPQLEEVDDDELAAVSGGRDEEAANGHEVGCWTPLWYDDWEEANENCCPRGRKVEGYKHYLLASGPDKHTGKCARCGYWVRYVKDEIPDIGKFYP